MSAFTEYRPPKDNFVEFALRYLDCMQTEERLELTPELKEKIICELSAFGRIRPEARKLVDLFGAELVARHNQKTRS